MRMAYVVGAAALLAAACAGPVVSCGRGGEEAREAAAKKQRDAGLLVLAYPESTGVQPGAMTIEYDGTTDRTLMTLRLSGLRLGGSGAPFVRQATLQLTSSYRGRVRTAGNPEGSVDGGLVVRAASAGILAFSGAPGTVRIGAEELPLKDPSGKDSGYSSAPAPGGVDEAVRFRFPTEHLVAAVSQGSVVLTIGTVKVEVVGQELADLREFTARMRP